MKKFRKKFVVKGDLVLEVFGDTFYCDRAVLDCRRQELNMYHCAKILAEPYVPAFPTPGHPKPGAIVPGFPYPGHPSDILTYRLKDGILFSHHFAR